MMAAVPRSRPPSDGRTSPITALSVVLLPTPFRPRRPTTSPGADLEGHAVEDVATCRSSAWTSLAGREHQVFR